MGAPGLGGCAFNVDASAFAGTTIEQTSCLLRRVRPRGTGATVQPVPAWLAAHVGRTTSLPGFDRYLAAHGIARGDIATAVDGATVVRYFVIHDTSSPEIPEASGFPAGMDLPRYGPNKLSNWNGDIGRRVNLIVARDGASRLFQPWGTARPLPAVKLESVSRVPAARPYFVHVENIQPRLKPQGSFAWKAPEPGLSAAQEQRLALSYVAASKAAGHWLIPAYHFNIDEGFPNGHDDPQNVDLASWVARVAAIDLEMGR